MAKELWKKMWKFPGEFFTTFRWREHLPSLLIVSLALLFILAVWRIVYLVDVQGGLPQLASVRGLWWHAFRNRGPVEWMQWVFLSLTLLYAAALSGVYWEKRDRGAQIFWGLIAFSFLLMLIEDTGDPRHLMAHYGYNYLGISKMKVEGIFYLFIAGPIIYGFLRFWKVPFSFPQTRLYLVTGGLMYALAASASVFRNQGDFYINIGERLSLYLVNGTVPGFFFMDFVLEETIELLAASLFFAGVLMYWRLMRENREKL